jgi:hypothetical protein
VCTGSATQSQHATQAFEGGYKGCTVRGFGRVLYGGLCHTGAKGRIGRTRGPEVQLGFGRVLYSGLCHTGAKNYEGLVFLGRQSGVIGHVLYG